MSDPFQTRAMPTSGQWVAFLVASFLFIQVPGPSLLFMLGRALTVSLREALLSVAGNALRAARAGPPGRDRARRDRRGQRHGVHGVKLAGAAYVVWLGIQAIRHRGDARLALLAGERAPERAGAAWLTGFVVGVTNPKTVLFFVAFLPQFTSPTAPTAPQIALLGLVFALMELVSDSAGRPSPAARDVAGAGASAPRRHRRHRWRPDDRPRGDAGRDRVVRTKAPNQ